VLVFQNTLVLLVKLLPPVAGPLMVKTVSGSPALAWLGVMLPIVSWFTIKVAGKESPLVPDPAQSSCTVIL